MEAQLFEKIGRLQVELENVKQAFENLLGATAKIVSGEIDRSRVMVNLTAKSIAWAPEGFRPEVPATINGEPRCVVAPVEEPAEDKEPPPAAYSLGRPRLG